MGGLVCLVSVGLLFLGSRNCGGSEFLLLFTFGCARFALILIRPVHLTPKAVMDSAPEPRLEVSRPDPIARIREEAGYHAIDRKLGDLKDRFGGLASQYLVGIFVRELSSRPTAYCRCH